MWKNALRSFRLPVCLAALFAAPAAAQGSIPTESCSGPKAISPPGCDAGVPVHDAGVGKTVVTTYGSAELEIRMPMVEDGMVGVAKLYHGMLRINMSYTAWDGSGTSLYGGSLPVPHLAAADLAEGANAVQPRPGTMPGLYLYHDDTSGWYYHYGSPVESGVDPQTTAIYKPMEGSGGGGMLRPAFIGPRGTIKYSNNLSGAQLWYYGDASTPYIEVKHVDGSIARFETFDPYENYTPTGELWRVVAVTDPYDNTANYVWSGAHRLERIEFPSGLKQHLNYAPSWGWGSPYDCLEITYEQGSTTLTDRTWAMVFTGTLGTSGGRHFGSRLYRTYSAKRDVLVDPSAGTPHTIGTGATAFGQIVHAFTYDTTGRSLKEYQSIHDGTAFAESLSIPTGLGTEQITETSYLSDGRVSALERTMLGETLACSYPTSGFRMTDLLSGASLAGIEVTDASGTVRRFEYDYNKGHLYRSVTTPSDDAEGRPRAHASDNSGIGGVASTDVEPEKIIIDNVFDGMCACQKPVQVQVISQRGSTDYTRVTNYEYYTDSHLLKKRSEPNPETGTSPPTEVHWEYTYIRAMATTGQDWGAWLIDEEQTPDGTYNYSYSNWLDRADDTNHGQIAGTVERSITDLRTPTSLTNPSGTSTTPVVETLHRNLSNSPGGLTQSGGINGQARRSIDGDGVATTMEYSTEGWLAAIDLYGGASRTTYAHNTYGEVSSISENVNSTSLTATTTFTLMSGVGVSKGTFSDSSGLDRETELYFDRWGHLAVSRQNNLAHDGNPPTNYAGTSTAARAWVEEQFLYVHSRLVDTFRDRERLDLPAGTGQFLHTELNYSDGRLASVVNPNGSVTHYEFDGYGTLYRSYVKDPTDSVTVTGPKRFVNPFLEVSGSYESTGSDHLWTLIERNGAGAITQITEPHTTAPSGYATPDGGGEFSTGGARHVFEIDKLGQVVRTKTYEDASSATLLLADREVRYDQLGRQIWQHDDARVRDVDATTTSSTGDHYIASKYRAGKSTQVDTVERSGVAAAAYDYWSSGFLKSITDGASNIVAYAYHSGTPYVSTITRTDSEPTSGTRVSTTSYGVDPFGRTISIGEGSSSPLVHSYAYDSLGNVDRYTDPMSRVQKFLPDAMGRIVEHVRVGDSSDLILNSSVFQDSGASDGRTKVTRADDLGNATITHFDFAGRPFIVQNPGAAAGTPPTSAAPNQPLSIYAEYDGASRVKYTYQGNVGRTEFFRDGMGRVIQQRLAATSALELDFDTYSLWNTRDFVRRDAMGRVAQADYWGADYTLLWAVDIPAQDSIGRIHSERFHFAGAPGNKIDIVSAYSGAFPYRSGLSYLDGLDPGGAASSSEPVSLQYASDSIGRLEQINWDKASGGSGSNPLAEYGWVGGLRRSRSVTYTSSGDQHGDTAFSYDQYGRLTQIVDDVWTTSSLHGVASQFDYEYDAASNLIKEKYLKVGTVGGNPIAGDRFAYDAYHRLTQAWMGVDSATMDPTPEADPSGFSSTSMKEAIVYTLDGANNRGLNNTSQTAAGTLTTDYTLQGSSPQGPSNRYDQIDDGSGAITQQYDNRGNLTYDGHFYYRYDYRNRLQEVWRIVVTESQAMQGATAEGLAPQAGASSQREQRFAVIDPQGLQKACREVFRKVPNLMQRALRDSQDPQLRRSLRASLPGGVIRMGPAAPTTGGGMLGPIVESAQIFLTQVYVYDTFNRRTITIPWEVQATAQLHTYDGWRQVAQYGLDTDGTNLVAVPRKQFVWSSRLDELISYRRWTATGWENYFVLHGGQDTSAKLVNEAGAVVEQYEYDPYGRASVYVGSSATPADESSVGLPFLWKGIRLDSETGLLYMRNRYYSTAMGRFLSNDALGVWSDSGNYGNAYCYAGNRPLVVGDPLGLQGDACTTGSPPGSWSGPGQPHDNGGTIHPSTDGGWRDEGGGVSSQDAGEFRDKELTKAEREVADRRDSDGKTLFSRGCIGVAQCLLGKAIFNGSGLGECYASESEAVAAAQKKECPSGQHGCIFSVRYWDKRKGGGKTKPGKGPKPIDPIDIAESHGRKRGYRFDFAYRQADGSYVGANHDDDPEAYDGDPMRVKHYKSDGAWNYATSLFNTTAYCITCCGCDR